VPVSAKVETKSACCASGDACCVVGEACCTGVNVAAPHATAGTSVK
jgi:hypothetical protein